ncbi:MAG: energy transducer TonB [Acidobacteriota bacterium]
MDAHRSETRASSLLRARAIDDGRGQRGVIRHCHSIGGSRLSAACCRAAAAAITLLLFVGPLAAQDFLSRAKELYEAANYQQALRLLDSEGEESGTPDERQTVREYRALCLLALDRTEEMAKTIERMIQFDPFYHPAPDRTPRLLTMFDRIHTRLLPSIVRERYSEAKANLEDGRYADSVTGFELVLRLIKEAGDKSNGQGPADQWLAYVRSLTTRVLDQIRVAQASPAQSHEPSPAETVYSRADTGVTPPVPLRQDIPPWQSAKRDPARFSGELELLIDAQGDVQDARILAPIHPSYDPVILSAATQWKYRPAMKDGKPVPYHKMIAISLVAPRNLAAVNRY